MTVAALIPTAGEYEAFVSAMESLGHQRRVGQTSGRILLPVVLRTGGCWSAQGGLGKVDFAVRTLHLVERGPPLDGVICLGTCGALSPELNIGDVVVATETVEHDFNRKLTQGPIPRFESDPKCCWRRFRAAESSLPDGVSVAYGPISSGDEGIDSSARARELMDRTGGIVAAWEGAGGAKACAFAGVPYIEVRCVSDLADEDAMTDYVENTPPAMGNLARLISKVVQLPVWRAHPMLRKDM